MQTNLPYKPNPRYLWLNLLLAAYYFLNGSIGFVLDILADAFFYSYGVDILLLVTGYLVWQMVPWIYVVIATLNMLALLFLLHGLSDLEGAEFLLIPLSIALISSAMFLRNHIYLRPEKAATQDSGRTDASG